MPIRKPKLTFEIDGQNVTPETVRLRDLYDVLSLFESAVAATAKSKGAQDTDDLAISLVDIDPGSDRVTIAMSDWMYEAAGDVSRSIANNDFSNIPVPAQAGLRALWNRSKSRGWQFDIYDGETGTIAHATITPQQEILKPGDVSGLTTIYGTLSRVGGVNPPTAWLTLLSGEHVVVTLKNTELAQALATQLYKVIGLEGEATWDMEDWSLKKFKADALTEYRDTDVVTAFHNLSAITGAFWDDIDPSEYIAQLRAD